MKRATKKRGTERKHVGDQTGKGLRRRGLKFAPISTDSPTNGDGGVADF